MMPLAIFQFDIEHMNFVILRLHLPVRGNQHAAIDGFVRCLIGQYHRADQYKNRIGFGDILQRRQHLTIGLGLEARLHGRAVFFHKSAGLGQRHNFCARLRRHLHMGGNCRQILCRVAPRRHLHTSNLHLIPFRATPHAPPLPHK